MTATQYIYGALRLLGHLRPGQAASASQNADGLTLLNMMLDEWNTQRYNVFTIATASYTLVTTQQLYPIGLTAVAPFNVARPIKIERAGILVTNPNGTGTVRFPLLLLTEHEWDQIGVKISSSPIPEKLYYDFGFPTGNLYLLPTPTWGTGTAPKLELSTWSALTQFPDLVTDEVFPPGYGEAIQFNLPLHLASSYPPAVSVDAVKAIVSTAAAAKAGIRALNQSNFKDIPVDILMEQRPAEPAGGPLDALTPQAPPATGGAA